MKLQHLIDYFLYQKDALDPDKRMKGRFFVGSFMIFFILCFVAEMYLFVTHFGGTANVVANAVLLVICVSFLYIYKYFGYRILLVNLLALCGSSSYFNTYELTGGIYSSDFGGGIAICCWIFLVADKYSGVVWFGLTTVMIILFYFFERAGNKDFVGQISINGPGYPLLGNLMNCVFVGVIIYLHESGKQKFLNELRESKKEVEAKSRELELRNKDILDSILYAKKIQTAVLPHEEAIQRSLPLTFIYYVPKDIVSGDFYWFHEINPDSCILICADCTGHGVPGAFMTVISSNLLNQTILDNKIYEPDKILLEVDRLLNMTLKQDHQRFENVQDGMDISMVIVDKKNSTLSITSAKRPVLFMRENKMEEIRASKFSLGGMRQGEKKFEVTTIQYRAEDMLYFFTDGYHDQFGSEKGKKFSSRRLKDLCFSIHQKPMPEQKEILAREFSKWKGNLEQVDDVCVVGIRF